MSGKNNMLKNKLIRENEIRSNYWNQFSRRCPTCCCTNYIKPSKDYIRCKICGTRIYQNEQTKFKYELKKRLLDANK